jgi:hypothetical protein
LSIQRLLDNGFSIEDIVAATVTAEKAQKQRLETFRNMKRDELGSFLGTFANWMISPIFSSPNAKATEERILSTKSKQKHLSFSARSA